MGYQKTMERMGLLGAVGAGAAYVGASNESAPAISQISLTLGAILAASFALYCFYASRTVGVEADRNLGVPKRK